jgi:hypothetical protein
MRIAQNLYKLNTVRKGMRNFPKSPWFGIASLLAGTKYGSGIGRALGLYAKIRMIMFLLWLAFLAFGVIVVFGILYFISSRNG